MKKYYTLNDFVGKSLVREDTGYYSEYSKSYDVNYSSILSLLIKEAGKYCKCYASDLFIDWENVIDELKQYSEDYEKSFLFGFRDCGVDHVNFILSNANLGYDLRTYYFAIYRLDIKKVHDICSMRLYLVQ